jgi:hypothetical protein
LEYDTDPDPKDGKASPGQGSVHLSIQIPAHNQKIKTKLVKKKKETGNDFVQGNGKHLYIFC